MKRPAAGIYVDDLYEPSPAVKAGIRRGDFILDVNGWYKISSVVDFQQSLDHFSACDGTSARYFRRDGKELQTMVTIESRPP
jgi:S1-C subfamily serine protease